MFFPGLWAAFALLAAVGQALRNAFQRDLVDKIGAANAAFVRFLFGAPFALGFLALAQLVADQPAPTPGAAAAGYIVFAASMQTLGTIFMLLAMRMRSFVVVTALMKTEPAFLVVFGAVFLGERLNAPGVAGVMAATLGVLLASMPRGASLAREGRALLLGLGSAAIFGLATAGYRGGAIALGGASPLLTASTELACSLLLQTLCILVYLARYAPAGLAAIAREWRNSLFAGFVGAASTLFWFLALSLETAARVRAVGLFEIFVAFAISRRFFAQGASLREAGGLALILLGVALVLLRAS